MVFEKRMSEVISFDNQCGVEDITSWSLLAQSLMNLGMRRD